jgi:hypothetical protein
MSLSLIFAALLVAGIAAIGVAGVVLLIQLLVRAFAVRG